MLAYYQLWLLRQKLYSARGNQDENVEASHWPVSGLVQMFEDCGVGDDLVIETLNRLYARRLIEALDPNAERVGIGDRVAIKETGLAHLELLVNSTVYVEQMALVTGVNEPFARDEMRRNNHPQNMSRLRDAFVRYILKIDAGRVAIPENPVYDQLRIARRVIAETLVGRRTR